MICNRRVRSCCAFIHTCFWLYWFVWRETFCFFVFLPPIPHTPPQTPCPSTHSTPPSPNDNGIVRSYRCRDNWTKCCDAGKCTLRVQVAASGILACMQGMLIYSQLDSFVVDSCNVHVRWWRQDWKVLHPCVSKLFVVIIDVENHAEDLLDRKS